MDERKNSRDVLRIVMEFSEVALRSMREAHQNDLDELATRRPRQRISGPWRQFLRWSVAHQTHHRGQTTI
jgi:uncharacterized damage-inducible protein DinB